MNEPLIKGFVGILQFIEPHIEFPIFEMGMNVLYDHAILQHCLKHHFFGDLVTHRILPEIAVGLDKQFALALTNRQSERDNGTYIITKNDAGNGRVWKNKLVLNNKIFHFEIAASQ